ncbi:MAG: hypothetical protein WKG07_21050 [Hymenobacter sp.]
MQHSGGAAGRAYGTRVRDIIDHRVVSLTAAQDQEEAIDVFPAQRPRWRCPW